MSDVTAKDPDAFRTISEAADELDLPQHVLRHWEDTFGQIRPMRRAGGRRYYRTHDIQMLAGVKTLLHDERYTTKGVQKIFKDHGGQYVVEIGKRAIAGKPFQPIGTDAAMIENVAVASADSEPGISKDAASTIRDELDGILTRLEGLQDTLDEAILALDTILGEED